MCDHHPVKWADHSTQATVQGTQRFHRISRHTARKWSWENGRSRIWSQAFCLHRLLSILFPFLAGPWWPWLSLLPYVNSGLISAPAPLFSAWDLCSPWPTLLNWPCLSHSGLKDFIHSQSHIKDSAHLVPLSPPLYLLDLTLHRTPWLSMSSSILTSAGPWCCHFLSAHAPGEHGLCIFCLGVATLYSRCSINNFIIDFLEQNLMFTRLSWWYYMYYY